jgi:hypothetical protein
MSLDRRSIGNADAVARRIARDARAFRLSIDTLARDKDTVLRDRAADAIERATRKHTELLQPHTRTLLQILHTSHQQEVQWHLLQVLPRLPLSRPERRRSFALCRSLLASHSRILAAEALTALCAISRPEPIARQTSL